jgi:hypothetical protein
MSAGSSRTANLGAPGRGLMTSMSNRAQCGSRPITRASSKTGRHPSRSASIITSMAPTAPSETDRTRVITTELIAPPGQPLSAEAEADSASQLWTQGVPAHSTSRSSDSPAMVTSRSSATACAGQIDIVSCRRLSESSEGGSVLWSVWPVIFPVYRTKTGTSDPLTNSTRFPDIGIGTVARAQGIHQDRRSSPSDVVRAGSRRGERAQARSMFFERDDKLPR